SGEGALATGAAPLVRGGSPAPDLQRRGALTWGSRPASQSEKMRQERQFMTRRTSRAQQGAVRWASRIALVIGVLACGGATEDSALATRDSALSEEGDAPGAAAGQPNAAASGTSDTAAAASAEAGGGSA